MLQDFSGSSVSTPNFINAIQREALITIGGALSREFLGQSGVGSRIGRNLVDNSQRNRKIQLLQAQHNEAVILIQNVKNLIGEIESIIGSRFSNSLYRAIAESESAKRPDTIIRRIIHVLNRLESHHFTSAKYEDMASTVSDLLRALEQALRECIAASLSKVSSNWWNERIPQDIRSKAEHRQFSREKVWPWLTGNKYSPAEYLSFPDYLKIILEQSNWDQVFAPIFLDADSLRVKLHELEPIRNDIFHSRELTLQNRERLKLYSQELISQIKDAERRKM